MPWYPPAVVLGGFTDWETEIGSYPIGLSQDIDLTPGVTYAWYRSDPTTETYVIFNAIFEMQAGVTGTEGEDIVIDFAAVFADALPQIGAPAFLNPSGTLVIGDAGPFALINPLALINSPSTEVRPFGLDGNNAGVTHTITSGTRLRVALVAAVFPN